MALRVSRHFSNDIVFGNTIWKIMAHIGLDMPFKHYIIMQVHLVGQTVIIEITVFQINKHTAFRRKTRRF